MPLLAEKFCLKSSISSFWFKTNYNPWLDGCGWIYTQKALAATFQNHRHIYIYIPEPKCSSAMPRIAITVPTPPASIQSHATTGRCCVLRTETWTIHSPLPEITPLYTSSHKATHTHTHAHLSSELYSLRRLPIS